jgi:YegS/Rv2252/BmrU family lipid kinase
MLLIIYNPHAGGGRAKQLLPPIQDYLQRSAIAADIKLTTHSGHAIELAEQADLSKYSAVIASGGDGTLFEVLNGVMKNTSSFKPPIGLIPNGTGNAFMKELKLKQGDWKKAIDIIVDNRTREVDVGRMQFASNNGAETESHYFINMVGLGFVSTVAQAAIPLKWLGNGAYTVATLQKLMGLKAQKFSLELDGQQIEKEGVFVEVANSKFTGTKFLMAPRAQLDDGLLDIVFLKKISRLKLLRLFTSIYDGSHVEYPEIEYYQAKNVKVTEQFTNRLIPDGEVLGQTPANFECIPRAIRFLWKS